MFMCGGAHLSGLPCETFFEWLLLLIGQGKTKSTHKSEDFILDFFCPFTSKLDLIIVSSILIQSKLSNEWSTIFVA